MAEELFERFREELDSVTVFPGRRGSFEVKVNGVQLFSKLDQERFPEPQEVEELIRERIPRS